MTGFLDVFGVEAGGPDSSPDLKPGDRVTVGTSNFPVWCVIAVHGVKAWMYREDTPWIDGVGLISHLRLSAEVISLEARA